MMSNKLNFRVLGGIGNILWQISAHAKRFGAENIQAIPGDERALKVLERWINPDKLTFSTNINEGYINGYYQDLYWMSDSETIKSWLNLSKGSILKTDTSAYELVVHVRGGDFKTSAAHKNCKQSIKLIDFVRKEYNITKRADVLIVSDDIETAKEATAYSKGWSMLVTSDDICAFNVMLQAKRLLVMPGSTFSLWAGYLGDQEKVFIPVGNWPCDNGYLKDVTSVQQSRLLVPSYYADSDKKYIAISDVQKHMHPCYI